MPQISPDADHHRNIYEGYTLFYENDVPRLVSPTGHECSMFEHAGYMYWDLQPKEGAPKKVKVSNILLTKFFGFPPCYVPGNKDGNPLTQSCFVEFGMDTSKEEDRAPVKMRWPSKMWIRYLNGGDEASSANFQRESIKHPHLGLS